MRELHLKPVERPDLNIWQLRARLAHELDPFIGRERGLLLEIQSHADDDAVKESRCPPDDVEMAVRGWIERSGVDRNAFSGHVVAPPCYR
ncbi:MAG: hypothetical protein NVS1B1_06250 [Candidatus Limnocylindrales bacterium]